MDIAYRHADDALDVRVSDAPVVKGVSYGWNVSVGYDAEDQLAEITILQLSSVLAGKCAEDESTLVLTARESSRLAEMLEQSPQRSARFEASKAKHREKLKNREPTIDEDAVAWLSHQARLLRNGSLNDIQEELLAAFFEKHADVQRQEFEALLRLILTNLWRLEHEPCARNMAMQLAEFRGRASRTLDVSPSLRNAVASRLESIWRDARMALKDAPSAGSDAAMLPENCPYTIEQVLADVAAEAAKTNADVADSAAKAVSTATSHITAVGRNIFFDLGFPPDEAERLKEESDQSIAAERVKRGCGED